MKLQTPLLFASVSLFLCLTYCLGNLPGECIFPSPLSSLPSTLCVLDLRSLYLRVRSQEHSRHKRVEAQSRILTKRKILPHPHPLQHTRTHTHTTHVRRPCACILDSSKATDNSRNKFIASLPLSHLSYGLVRGQENKQNTIEWSRIEYHHSSVLELSLTLNNLLKTEGARQLS